MALAQTVALSSLQRSTLGRSPLLDALFGARLLAETGYQFPYIDNQFIGTYSVCVNESAESIATLVASLSMF